MGEKELGNDAYKKKDFEEALTHYNRAIELDPKAIMFRNNRAGSVVLIQETVHTVRRANDPQMFR